MTSEQENWWENSPSDRPSPSEAPERPQSTYLERTSPQAATWRVQNALKDHFTRQQAQVDSSEAVQVHGDAAETNRGKQKKVSAQVDLDKGDKQVHPNEEGDLGEGPSSGSSRGT